MIYPFGGDNVMKFYWGTSEVLLPVYKDTATAGTVHPHTHTHSTTHTHTHSDEVWPLHDIAITNIVWCIAPKRGAEGRLYIAH